MPKAQFLTKNRHNSRYHFRGHIPADLRSRFGGQREFRIALDTCDKQVAKRTAMAMWVQLQARYDEFRAALHLNDNSQNQEITKLKLLLSLEKQKRRMVESDRADMAVELDFAERAAQRAKAETVGVAKNAVVALAGIVGQDTSVGAITQSKAFNLIADEYFAGYARTGGRGKPPVRSTLGKKREKLEFWTGLYGDLPIHEIDRAEIGRVQDAIYNLPGNSTKLYASPADAMAAAIAGHQYKVISGGKTAVDYLRALGEIFRHANRRGYIDDNPAMHLLEVVQHKAGATQKPPFTRDDLSKIFPATYGADFHRKGIPDPAKMAARFWIPLLSLFSGARVEELCQLNADDVGLCVDTGTPYYRITSEGEAHDGQAKSLKNKNSIRLVPIHPRLIEIGFLDFVAERLNEGGETAGLFALKRSDGQRMGKQISSWFARLEQRTKRNGDSYVVGGYIENQGVVTGGEIGGKRWSKSFHTFRHTLINHLLNSKHPTTGEEFTEDQIDQLTGHRQSQSGVKHYIQEGHKSMQLRAAMITAVLAVDFDFLPFNQIRWERFKSEYL
jgi:integrase